MPRDIEEPNTDTVHGDEQHPAWGMIGASRVSHSPPGAVLFDSDIRHQHSVVIRIGKATRRRDLHRDWLYRKREFIEVEMSEAQWASFVSSMNSGDGVACTLRYRDGEPIPGMPYAPRLQESMGEVRDAAEKTIADVAKAFAAYKAHKTVGNLRFLEATISNLPANVSFTAESLSEHAENVVQRARADIEAMVLSKAQQLGIDPGELGVVPQLTGGDE